MAKGDKVEVLLQAGDKIERFTVSATGNGDKVEVNTSARAIEVLQLNRNGGIVRTVRFKPEAVLAVNEEPVR